MLSERGQCCKPFDWHSIQASDQIESDRDQLEDADRVKTHPDNVAIVRGSPRYFSGLSGFRKRLFPDRDSLRSEGLVRVVHGVRDLALPLAGKTVREVRETYRGLLNFRHDAHAVLEGERITEDHVLGTDETLEFLFPYGIKGGETDEVLTFIRTLLALPGRYDEIIETLSRIDRQQTELGAMVKDIHESVLAQRPLKEWYTVSEMADILGKRPYTVREWLRLGRLKGEKKACGRGKSKEWMVSHEEMTRYQNEGLSPLR